MQQDALQELQDVLAKLLGPDGCPWDKQQTPESLADYVIEESHELVSAIRQGNVVDVCEELGDVLFLLLFITQLYAQAGKFSLEDVLRKNSAKMIRRHPHVFGETKFDSMTDLLKTWESIKRSEHANDEQKPQGVFDSLPASLPALLKAYRLLSKASRVGFTCTDDEEAEQQVEANWLQWLDSTANGDTEQQKKILGDLFFNLTELGRRKGVKANEVLELANIRFLRHFEKMEALARQKGQDFATLSTEEKKTLSLQAENDV